MNEKKRQEVYENLFNASSEEFEEENI